MNIEIKEGVVLKDGEKVGALDAGSVFVPVEGLHHKTAASIVKHLESLALDGGESDEHYKNRTPEIPPIQIEKRPLTPEEEETAKLNPEAFQHNKVGQCDPAPVPDPAAGDKDPEYIKWYRRNHSPEQFEEKYGNRKFTMPEEEQ